LEAWLNHLNGYDLDGTLCSPSPKRNKPFFRQNAAERSAYQVQLREHYLSAPVKMKPRKPYIVITGRKECYRPETELWLRTNKLKPMVLVMNTSRRTREAMIEHKTSACQKAGVGTYFEDDPKIARALRAAGINVVLIKHT
jgi:hypothetical protein